MPSWHMLPDKDRIAVIQYIKYELAVDRSDPEEPYAYFVEEPAEPPIYIGQAPDPSEEIVAHGKEIWQQAKCWECHGQTGKGDGEKEDAYHEKHLIVIGSPSSFTQFRCDCGCECAHRVEQAVWHVY